MDHVWSIVCLCFWRELFSLLSLSGWLLGASFVTTSRSASINVRPVRRDALAGAASAVASHAKQSRWQQASDVVANLSPRRLQLDVSLSNALVSAIGRGSKWLRALCAFSAMRRSRLDHDHISFNSGISACGRGGAWKQAVHLSALLQTEDLSRDVVTFNAGISACEIHAKWPTALSIFRDACNGVKLHLVTFGAMLTTARRAAAWEVTLAALRQMRPRSLYPNEVCGNAAVAALRTQSAKWADARSLLMVEPGASSTSLVLSSLARAWREVFQLLSQWGDGSLLTVPTLNAGITACHRGSRWEMSLWILSKMMCSSGPRPDAITCASTLAGCERGQRWQFVARLLRAFHRLSTQLDLTVNQAALSAAAKGHAWRSATQGIHEAMQEGFGLSVAAINTAAFACQSGKRWRWSAELIGQLRLAAVRPDHFSATSLLASAWPTALHALQGFNLLMLKYDDLACSSIMTTLSFSKIWDRALLLQQQLPSNIGDVLACDVLTSACETSGGLEPVPALLVQETFGALSAEEQKKITEALAKVETKAETAAAPATGETPSTEAKPEKAEEPEMTDEQLSMLKAAFDDIDTNASKYIEAAELKTVLGKMKVELSDDQIDAVFKRADLNKDGKLSFDEYKKLVSAGMQVAK
ncbi:PPR10 [Symbiodinium sp. CCMP2456]|nr:PPR10 [Symbiodinium sp. CCMP2456]